MPVMFPSAAAMAFELGTYALVIGLCYNHSKWKCVFSLYRSLIIAMLSGSIVMTIFMDLSGKSFGISAFISGAVLNSIPGIIAQLILIPAIMVVLGRTHLIQFGKSKNETAHNA